MNGERKCLEEIHCCIVSHEWADPTFSRCLLISRRTKEIQRIK